MLISFLFPFLNGVNIFLISLSKDISFFENKFYIPGYLLLAGFEILIYRRKKWLSLLLLFLWIPPCLTSLYRSFIVFIFLLFTFWIIFFISEIINQYFRINKLGLFFIIPFLLAFEINVGNIENFLFKFSSNTLQNYPRAFNQIVYKTFYDDFGSKKTRDQAFNNATKFPNIFPSTLGDSLFVDYFSTKATITDINVLDSGFLYLSIRLGILSIPILFFLLISSLRKYLISIIFLSSFISFLFLLYAHGLDIYYAHCALSLGIFISFLIPHRSIFIKKS